MAFNENDYCFDYNECFLHEAGHLIVNLILDINSDYLYIGTNYNDNIGKPPSYQGSVNNIGEFPPLLLIISNMAGVASEIMHVKKYHDLRINQLHTNQIIFLSDFTKYIDIYPEVSNIIEKFHKNDLIDKINLCNFDLPQWNYEKNIYDYNRINTVSIDSTLKNFLWSLTIKIVDLYSRYIHDIVKCLNDKCSEPIHKECTLNHSEIEYLKIQIDNMKSSLSLDKYIQNT